MNSAVANNQLANTEIAVSQKLYQQVNIKPADFKLLNACSGKLHNCLSKIDIVFNSMPV